MSDIDDDMMRLYDEYVKGMPEGAKLVDIREGIRDELREIIAKTRRDIDREVESQLARLEPARSKRARSLKKQIEYILDALSTSEPAEDGAYVDPMMDHAYRLGTADGMDKTLRFWTMDDFRNVVVVRYRVAGESMAAAVELDKTVQRAIDAMRVGGAARFGDLG